jgi:hypothetical protein
MEDITFSDSLKIKPGGSISFTGDAKATLIIDDEVITLSASTSLETYCQKHPGAPECKIYDV